VIRHIRSALLKARRAACSQISGSANTAFFLKSASTCLRKAKVVLLDNAAGKCSLQDARLLRFLDRIQPRILTSISLSMKPLWSLTKARLTSKLNVLKSIMWILKFNVKFGVTTLATNPYRLGESVEIDTIFRQFWEQNFDCNHQAQEKHVNPDP
jgi:hypothetical protein